MKVFKLSLAAALAAGALSSVSAAPLEEAIKDIDVSGFGRYRYENRHDTSKTNGDKSVSNYTSFHRFTLDVNFKATLDDNFFSVIGVRYDAIDVSGRGGANPGISNTHGGLDGINGGWGGANADSLSIRQYYVGYKGIPDTVVLAGRQPIGAFFTDDIVGTGLKVANNSVEGLTLAAIAFDAIENDGDLANNSLNRGLAKFVKPLTGLGILNKPQIGDNGVSNDKRDPLDPTKANHNIEQNNLYGVAAIYSYEWFNAQAWYAYLQNVTNLWAVDLGANYAIDDVFSVRGRVNVGGGHFTSHMHSAYNKQLQSIDTQYGLGLNPDKISPLANTYMVGVNLGLTYDWVSLDAGYITYGKKGRIGALTLESNAKYIASGEYVLNYTNFTGKHNVWFGKVGFKYDAYSLGLDYTHDTAKGSEIYDNGAKTKNNAFTIRAGYKYNDKLSFAAWWELQNAKTTYDDNRDSVKDKYNRFRFDARYNF